MGREHGFWEQLMQDPDFDEGILPTQPIIEISGDRRVLIENHFGVKAYSQEKILVAVKYGCVCVCGAGLDLLHMTKEQLVIRGRIDSVALQRRR